MISILVAGIVISALAFTFLLEARTKKLFASLQKKKASHIALHISSDIREHMLTGPNYDSISRLLTSHTLDNYVETALFKHDGSLYAGKTVNTPPGELFAAPRDLSIESKEGFLFYRPLLNEKACAKCHEHGKPLLGVIMVAISYQEQSAYLQSISSSMAFFTIIMAAAGGGVLILLLKKMVFSPLSELHYAAEMISSGDLHHRIRIPNRDEFGALASAFNQMAESIEKSHAVIEDAVRQRTKELEDTTNRFKNSEARLKEAEHIARMGSWEYDAETEKFTCSEETYTIFGKTPADTMTLSSFLESVHPEDRQALSLSVEHAIASGQTDWGYDFRILLPEGEIRHLHAEERVLLNESGIIVNRIGTVQDINERKKKEAALYSLIEEVSGKTDRDLFRSLVERLARTLGTDFAYVGELTEDMDHVRAITFYARGQFRDNIDYALAGTPCNDVMGKELHIYPQHVQKLFPEDNMLVEMEAESYIGIPLFASSGRPLGIMAALSSRPMTDLKFLEFVFTMFAIRASSELERSQSDRLLKSQQELSDAIFDSTTSGIMVLDNKGNVLRINREGAAIFRSGADELTGKNLAEIWTEAKPFLTVDGALREEIILANHDGSTTPIGFSTSPLRNAQGAEAGVIVLFRDLSEMKKLQAALKKKEHFETIGKLVSGVAHEVRNPLFGISSIGQILERESDKPQHQALISAMLRECDRLKNLIEELLMYTRPARLDIREIDLALLFMGLEHHIKGKKDGIEISIEIPPSLTISADRDKITQVLLNVLNNAIEAAQAYVRVTATRAGSKTEIRIGDDGQGIPQKNIEKIFEPFFTTKKGGTGLGLPICKKLIEDHDGSIEIISLEEKGTEVVLRLKS